MKIRIAGLALLLTAVVATAQQNPPPQPVSPPSPPGPQPQPAQMRRYGQQQPGRGPMQPGRGRGQMQGQGQPPMMRALGGPPGKWWDRPELVQRLSLTPDQQKRMDDVFQQARLKLVDLNAAVEKEELIMEPLLAAETPDENRIVSQIDKLAQARAELEKANARMLLGIRRVLTKEQWEKLKTEPVNNQPQPAGPGPGPQGRGPRR